MDWKDLEKDAAGIAKVLQNRGYRADWRTYDIDGSLQRGTAKELLTKLGKIAQVRSGFTLHSTQPVVVEGRPYHYSLHMSYRLAGGFTVLRMDLDTAMALRSSIAVRRPGDLPRLEELPGRIRGVQPAVKPRNQRLDAKRIKDIHKQKGKRR